MYDTNKIGDKITPYFTPFDTLICLEIDEPHLTLTDCFIYRDARTLATTLHKPFLRSNFKKFDILNILQLFDCLFL